MGLFFLSLPGRGAGDAFLSALAERLQAAGLRLAGALQERPSESAGPGPCAIDLWLLPTGPRRRISEARGALARGCRLDSGALEEAVALVEARLAEAELCLLNKFGKREGEGRGFAPLIGTALLQGLPVVIGVGAQNLAAFETFAGGLATPLPPDLEQAEALCRAACRRLPV